MKNKDKNFGSNRVYQKLQQNSSTKCQRTSNKTPTNYTREKAISAYKSQIAYTAMGSFEKAQKVTATRSAENARKIEQNEKKFETENIKKTAIRRKKRGFLGRILDWFRKDKSIQKVVPKPSITGVKVPQESIRYSNKTRETKKSHYIENDFEKVLRDMRNYSKENHYVTYKNGHKRNYEPRYL